METVFARREPDRRLAIHGYDQIAVYKTGEILPCAVFPFGFESQPKSEQVVIRVQGLSYLLKWLPPLIGPPVDAAALRHKAMVRRMAQ